MSKMQSKFNVRLFPVLVAFVFLVAVLHPSSPASLSLSSLRSPSHSPAECSPKLDGLQDLELSSSINYARIEIHVHYGAGAEHTRSEALDVELPAFREISLDVDAPTFQREECPLALQMHFDALPSQPDMSFITFGVATTLERLELSLHDFAHWIQGSNARMVALLEPASEADARLVEQRAAAMGFDLEIHMSDMSFTDRYFTLSKLIYEGATDTTEWGILIDDDTFFMSPNGLVDFLSQFDSQKPYYIGGLTEDFGQIKNFGIIGYGGASIILSKPLLKEIHEVYDACLAHKSGGDLMIAHCVYTYTTTKFTMEHRLHQFDMNGDLSGIYESGRAQPLSVHHWKSWHDVNMTTLSAVSSICGTECLLQRWKFADGWWLTNGYSLVKYSEERPVGDITIEHTWRESGDYRHSFDPLREKDEEKVSLRLERVMVHEKTVRQFYVRRVKGGTSDVFELVWVKA